jgi:hypothetical protein
MHRARDARRRIDSFSSFVIPAQAGTQKRQALPYAALGPSFRWGDGKRVAAHQIFRAARLPPHAARFLQACHGISVGRLFSIVEPTHAMRGSETPPPPPRNLQSVNFVFRKQYTEISAKICKVDA